MKQGKMKIFLLFFIFLVQWSALSSNPFKRKQKQLSLRTNLHSGTKDSLNPIENDKLHETKLVETKETEIPSTFDIQSRQIDNNKKRLKKTNYSFLSLSIIPFMFGTLINGSANIVPRNNDIKTYAHETSPLIRSLLLQKANRDFWFYIFFIVLSFIVVIIIAVFVFKFFFNW